jgi:hypothetical protein
VLWLYNHESIGVAWNEAGISRRLGREALGRLKLFTHITWAIIVVSAAAGLMVLVRVFGIRRAVCGPIGLSIVFYTVVHAIVVSQDRYHLEFAAQLAMLAGAAFAAIGLPRGKATAFGKIRAFRGESAHRAWTRPRELG